MAAATEKTFWDKRYGRNFLKITALLTMLIDHIGCVFLMERGDIIYKAFRAVGRISFPIICFLLVEGFIHTHSRKKYMINLLIFAVISEIPYDLAFGHKLIDVGEQNVMWTLLLGVIMMYFVAKWEYSFVVKMALVFLAGFVAVVLKTDYSIWGILLIAIFYMQRNDRRNALLYTCFLMFVQGRMQSFGVLAIPFIMAYDDTKNDVKMPKYFFYAFYPVHILVLWGISLLV